MLGDILYLIITGPGLTLAVFGVGIALSLSLLRFFRPSGIVKALKSSPKSGVSPFRAMCVALAGTLGVGNIVGVASAIMLGGAGTIFWMWVSSFFAMAIKYAETLLALKRRRRLCDGWHGGAFFYISDFGTVSSKLAAAIFAALCILAAFTLGGAIQSNAAALCLKELFELSLPILGILLGAVCLLMLSDGFSGISDFTVIAIPLASISCVALSSIIIFSNLPLLPSIFREIFASALGNGAFEGGLVGFFTSKALALGVTRGIVSNEAGCGTAPIAHSSSDTAEPAAQGIWGMLEVVVDTPILCTLTALVMLIAHRKGIALPSDGMGAALAAFDGLMPGSGRFLCVSVVIFALSTLLSWSYYGGEALRYLIGRDSKLYKVLYSLAVGFGAATVGDWLWKLSDATIGLMTAFNLFYVVRCLPELRRETHSYFLPTEQNFVGKGVEKKSSM